MSKLHPAYIFGSTYMCMVARHTAILSWSMVTYTQIKKDIKEELQFSGTMLGTIDTGFLLCYAIGNLLGGFLGMYMSHKILAAGGMILSGLFYWILAGCGYAGITWSPVFIAIFAMEGLCQAPVFVI